MTGRQLANAAAAALLLIATAATLHAQHPRRDGGLRHALARAEADYEAGDLRAALDWLDRARALVAGELDGPGDAAPPRRSNAAELLGYLDYYRVFAAGRDPRLDGEARFLGGILADILLLESGPDVPRRLGDRDVGTWTDGKVHRLGDLSIGHWADGRIHRVDDLSIGYWADGRPHRIGGIEFAYRAGEREPAEVAGVTIR